MDTHIALIKAMSESGQDDAGIAAKAGISRATVYRLRHAYCDPTLKTADAIAAAIGKELRLIDTPPVVEQ